MQTTARAQFGSRSHSLGRRLMVGIAILAVGIGAAVPLTGEVLTYRARQATREELTRLAEASSEFFRDVRRPPLSIEELWVDPGDAGWSGPYLPGVPAGSIGGPSDDPVDAWSRPYELSSAGDVLTLGSRGEDGRAGTADDLAVPFDVGRLRREMTLERLQRINQAIVLYNGRYQASDPLPADWPAALTKLVARGLLPTAAGHDVDLWGDTFVEDPVGISPVVRVRSPHVSS